MRTTKVWERLLGVERTVVESVEFEERVFEGYGVGVVVVDVRPRARWTREPRCGRCGVRSALSSR